MGNLDKQSETFNTIYLFNTIYIAGLYYQLCILT